MQKNESGRGSGVTIGVAVGIVLVVLFPDASAAIVGGAMASLGAHLLRHAFRGK